MKMWELLSTQDKWTQGIYAEDKDGEPIEANSPDAVRWCLLGAIFRCYPYLEDRIKNKIIDKIMNAIEEPLSVFNDTHNYEEVMKVIKELDI